MRLKSEIVKDIQILMVSDKVTEKDTRILRAGIIQFFKNGKNRIILELLNAGDLAPEALREISILDVMARELSGRIVAAGVDEATKAKIVAFANPPVILCFPTRVEALQHFEKERAPTAAMSPASAESSPEVLKGKEKIRDRELGDLGSVRRQAAEAQAENETLREQLRILVMERRQPPNAASYQARIDELESHVVELNTRLKDQDSKKA